MGMVELGDGLGLATEPGDVLGAIQSVAENLERDDPVERGLPGLVDHAHSARAEPTLDHEIANRDIGVKSRRASSRVGSRFEVRVVLVHDSTPLPQLTRFTHGPSPRVPDVS